MDNIYAKIDRKALIRMADNNFNNPYVDVVPYELGYRLPIVHYRNFVNLKSGENIIYASYAATFTDKEKVVGYSGKSSGMSVRIAKGLTYRTGGNSGRPIRGKVRDFYYGDIIITNQRVIFTGQDDHFEYSLDSITVTKMIYKDAILIQKANSSRNICFSNDAICLYAYSILTFLLEQHGVLDVSLFRPLTPIEVQSCNGISGQLKKYRKHGKNRNNHSKGRIITWSIVLCLVFVVVIACIELNKASDNMDNKIATNSKKVVDTSGYSTLQLTMMEDHPKVFSDYNKARKFYISKGFDVDDNKSRVIVTEPRPIQDKYNYPLLLYSKDGEAISEFSIYFDKNQAKSITIEQAMKISGKYLPGNFNKYYDTLDERKGNDTDGGTWYIYSAKLNSVGSEYVNNKGADYSDFFSVHIRFFKNGSKWIHGTETKYDGFRNAEDLHQDSSKWNSGFEKYIGKWEA